MWNKLLILITKLYSYSSICSIQSAEFHIFFIEYLTLAHGSTRSQRVLWELPADYFWWFCDPQSPELWEPVQLNSCPRNPRSCIRGLVLRECVSNSHFWASSSCWTYSLWIFYTPLLKCVHSAQKSCIFFLSIFMGLALLLCKICMGGILNHSLGQSQCPTLPIRPECLVRAPQGAGTLLGHQEFLIKCT